MGTEAVMVQQLEDRLLEVTVDDAAAISAMTLLKLADPNTGSASSADGDLFLGILASAKVALDGQTRMTVWRHGVFDLTSGPGTITGGEMVKISGANLIWTADDDTVGNMAEIVGLALQSAGANEVIEVLVGAH